MIETHKETPKDELKEQTGNDCRKGSIQTKLVKEPPKPKAIRVSKNITKRAVGKTKRELFNKTPNERTQIPNDPPKPDNEVKSDPVKVEKPKKQKRKMSEKQLAHLARIRKLASAKRAENKRLRQEMKKKDPKVQKSKAKKQQFEVDVKEHI